MKTGKNNWNELLKTHFIFGVSESEGSFQYGNYRREADDLRAVVEHFHEEKRFIAAIVGHSKGITFESQFMCDLVNLHCVSPSLSPVSSSLAQWVWEVVFGGWQYHILAQYVQSTNICFPGVVEILVLLLFDLSHWEIEVFLRHYCLSCLKLTDDIYILSLQFFFNLLLCLLV